MDAENSTSFQSDRFLQAAPSVVNNSCWTEQHSSTTERPRYYGETSEPFRKQFDKNDLDSLPPLFGPDELSADIFGTVFDPEENADWQEMFLNDTNHGSAAVVALHHSLPCAKENTHDMPLQLNQSFCVDYEDIDFEGSFYNEFLEDISLHETKKGASKQVPGNPKTTTNISLVNAAIAIKPTENDVLMGRGGCSNNHVGNKKYHRKKKELQPKYFSAPRHEKKRVAMELAEWVHDTGGRFVQKTNRTDEWEEAPLDKVILKCSQALRTKKRR